MLCQCCWLADDTMAVLLLPFNVYVDSMIIFFTMIIVIGGEGEDGTIFDATADL